MDVVTRVEHGYDGYHVSFEKSRWFYARHMVSMPRTLIGWALRIFWKDFKALCLGGERVSKYERVSDTLESK